MDTVLIWFVVTTRTNQLIECVWEEELCVRVIHLTLTNSQFLFCQRLLNFPSSLLLPPFPPFSLPPYTSTPSSPPPHLSNAHSGQNVSFRHHIKSCIWFSPPTHNTFQSVIPISLRITYNCVLPHCKEGDHKGGGVACFFVFFLIVKKVIIKGGGGSCVLFCGFEVLCFMLQCTIM